jgi:uncharacterized membrane protein YvbJ
MPYCPKCGSKVTEDMTFCPKCGSSLQVATAAQTKPAPAPARGEKGEKHEKEEKGEKKEKPEKGGIWLTGLIIGGILLVIVGFMEFLNLSGLIRREFATAIILVIIGAVVILGAIYAFVVASRRHPAT